MGLGCLRFRSVGVWGSIRLGFMVGGFKVSCNYHMTTIRFSV